MKKLLLTTATIVMLSSPTFAEEYTVKMITNFDVEQVYYFESTELTVQTGDTVKWVNAQEGIHKDVAEAVPKGADLFKSPILENKNSIQDLASGDIQGTYSYSYSYSYHCIAMNININYIRS